MGNVPDLNIPDDPRNIIADDIERMYKAATDFL